MQNPADVAAAWISLQRSEQESVDATDLSWAADEINIAAVSDPDYCWLLICEILSQSKNEWILANLAAGPIEAMLSLHGKAVIGRVESLAQANPHFRQALGGVWNSAVESNVWSRVLRAGK